MLTSNGYALDTSPARLGALERVSSRVRADRDALWTRLRRDGYLFLPRHLDPELVMGFREYYFTALAPTGLTDARRAPRDGIASEGDADRAELRRILYDDIIPGPRYAALTAHPDIRGWFDWFLGADTLLHKRRIIRHIGPKDRGIGTATQAHYDLVYLREGTDRVLSIWIPLGDVPVSLGGLTYLEGSHHRVLADEREGRLRRPAASITADLPGLADEYDTRWLVADYQAGDVVVHSAHIIHAATDNDDADGRIRLSTDIRYQRRTDPIDWRWQQHYHEDDGL